MRRLPVVLISVAVLGILFVVLCTFVQRPYEDVILDRFGRVVLPGTIMDNWKLCLPTDKVVRFDRRLHLYQTILQQVNVGGESLCVKTYAAWQITDPKRFYERTSGSDKTAEQFLTQKVMGKVGERLASLSVGDLFNSSADRKVKIEDVEAEVMKEINGQLAGTGPGTGEGMELVQLGFSRMAFPPAVADAVYKRMVQDRATEAQKAMDEGNREASRLRAEGDLERNNIISASKKIAEPLRGQADAAVVKILAAVMGTDEAKDFYQYKKSMELFRNSLTKNTYLVLPSNSPLIEFLLTPPSRGPAKPPEKLNVN